MKSLLIVPFLISLSLASPGFGPLSPKLDESIQMTLSGFRGFRDGYLTKMHLANKWRGEEIPSHDTRGLNDSRCFGSESEVQIYEVASFFSYGELYQIGTILDDISAFVSDLRDNCLVKETW